VLSAPAALGSSAKSIYAEKICPTILTTHSCTVSISTLRTLRGADWHYNDYASLGLPAGSPMLITTADTRGVRAGTAAGVCHFVAPAGHCEFSSGTGSPRGFNANFAVLFIHAGPPTLSLTGVYWFDRGNGDENDVDQD
jgi:hypothetical protein